MKLKGALFGNSHENIEKVYGDEQLDCLRSICSLRPEIVSSDNFGAIDLRELEVIFSTWGMPVFTESEIAAKMPCLKAVFYAAGAVDYFCHPYLKLGIKVCSAWKANAIPVAEFTVSQIVLGLKNYFQLARAYKAPGACGTLPRGFGSFGRTVALIGSGAVSSVVQQMLASRDLKVTVIPSGLECGREALADAFANSQVVSNHLPDRDDLAGIITGDMLTSMPYGGVFINTGRGRQVDEYGMTDALEKRPDLTALLDVTFPEPPKADSKLFTLPNVFLSPHLAGSLGDETHRMACWMIEEYKRFAAGEQTLYSLDESMLLNPKKQG